MVPLHRALVLVSSYRLSILTTSFNLIVSEHHTRTVMDAGCECAP